MSRSVRRVAVIEKLGNLWLHVGLHTRRVCLVRIIKEALMCVLVSLAGLTAPDLDQWAIGTLTT